MEESVRFKPTGGGSFNPLSVYPVGSIYISVSSTNPSELFGGTWEQISGRFLVGVGANKANTNNYWGTFGAGSVNFPAGELGGEAQHKLTEAEMPSHRHTYNKYFVANDGGSGNWVYNRQFSVAVRRSVGSTTVVPPNDEITYGTVCHEENLEQPMNTAGGSQPHNNLPPYLAVYMWQRVA